MLSDRYSKFVHILTFFSYVLCYILSLISFWKELGLTEPIILTLKGWFIKDILIYALADGCLCEGTSFIKCCCGIRLNVTVSIIMCLAIIIEKWSLSWLISCLTFWTGNFITKSIFIVIVFCLSLTKNQIYNEFISTILIVPIKVKSSFLIKQFCISCKLWTRISYCIIDLSLATHGRTSIYTSFFPIAIKNII